MWSLLRLLQNFPADLWNVFQELPNIVAFDGEMWRRFVIPAVVSVQIVVLPQMKLVWPELHPRDARIERVNAFHAESAIESRGALDVAHGN